MMHRDYRKRLILVVIVVLAVYLGGMLWLRASRADLADFILRALGPLAISGAVLAALFGEYLREKIFPIDLCIEVTKEQERNAVFDHRQFNEEEYRNTPIYTKAFDVYCHHLRVRNLTLHRALKDCRVWLKKVEVQDVAGNWTDQGRFAVPRLMDWAPFEYSRDKRTFSSQQVFDFGQTLSHSGGFVITVNPQQGGTFNRWFNVGEKVRFYFYATAENYQIEKEFCFEVEVPHSLPSQKVTPAKIKDVGNA